MNEKNELLGFPKISYTEWLNSAEKSLPTGKKFENYISDNEGISVLPLYYENPSALNYSNDGYNYFSDENCILWEDGKKNNFGLVIDSIDLQNKGASPIDQVTYLIHSLINKEIKGNILIKIGIGQNIFIEISKIISFKRLLNALLNKYETNKTVKIFILTEPTLLNKSHLDNSNNLIRLTLETAAALISNVNYIHYNSYNLNGDDEFAISFSQNILKVLSYESNLDFFKNSYQGSYFIENIIEEMIISSFDRLKSLSEKNENDVMEYFESSCSHNYKENLEFINSRKKTLIGVNKYPNVLDIIDDNNISNSYAKGYEKLREKIHTLKNDGLEAVNLYIYSRKDVLQARILFTIDFFKTAGLDVLESYFEVLDEVKTHFDITQPKIICLIAEDIEYEKLARSFVVELTSIAKPIILIAGNVNNISELKEIGLYDCVNIKTNYMEIMTRLVEELQ